MYAGLRMRWFTNRIRLLSHTFNPMCQSYIPWTSNNHRTRRCSRRMGLAYGEVYGGSFFAAAMESSPNNSLTYYDGIYSSLDLARFCIDQTVHERRATGTKDDWTQARSLTMRSSAWLGSSR